MAQVTSTSSDVSGKQGTQQHVILCKLLRRRSREKSPAGVQTKWPIIKYIGHRWDLHLLNTKSDAIHGPK